MSAGEAAVWLPAMHRDETAAEIRHDVAARRFESETGGHVAVLDYERADGEIALTHTFVPPELRGRGLAERLVRAALDFARREKLRVNPVCSYVATFLQRHPELAKPGEE